jgi:uncharacterized protein (DUF433 family)
MEREELLQRITTNPAIYGGKPIIRGQRMAVEHVVQMLAAGDSAEDLLTAYPWMEREDIQACLLYVLQVFRRDQQPALSSNAK